MNQYVTGGLIKKLREKNHFTQAELASKINVSDKTISKWETGKGFPDITLLEPLATALNLSVIELLSGKNITNHNRCANMAKIKLYVCPVCGNVIQTIGEAVISCCGIALPQLEAEPADEEHSIQVDKVEDEYYVQIRHEMTKVHYISFIAGVYTDGIKLVKLYPEGAAEARFKISGLRGIYYYCNRDGLFMDNIK
ncbi:helix-turn-helix domain-containing protein [Anaerovibrio sp. RM50]|uniref:helix-turn-helix domain-containing protein n=1 Tax=Anaerovibrio sp. RM50 TaxID=1200557 RepID=UPI0004809AC8|nr:helix-turn-helix domain-containing protein [Anaerovibrio sp. RM50]